MQTKRSILQRGSRSAEPCRGWRLIICLICAAGISGMYLLTNPIIEANTSKTELETIQTIYENYDQNKSETQTTDFANDYITKKMKNQ